MQDFSARLIRCPGKILQILQQSRFCKFLHFCKTMDPSLEFCNFFCKNWNFRNFLHHREVVPVLEPLNDAPQAQHVVQGLRGSDGEHQQEAVAGSQMHLAQGRVLLLARRVQHLHLKGVGNFIIEN